MVVMLCHIQIFISNDWRYIWEHSEKMLYDIAKQAILCCSASLWLAFQQAFTPCGVSELETETKTIQMDFHKDNCQAADQRSAKLMHMGKQGMMSWEEGAVQAHRWAGCSCWCGAPALLLCLLPGRLMPGRCFYGRWRQLGEKPEQSSKED